MQLHGMRRAKPTLVAVLLVLSASRSAGAAPVQNVVGHWMGIFQSKVNMQDFGGFAVEIPTQSHRRFMCTLTIAGNSIPCDGTIAASGQFEVVARRGVFQVHGMYHGDGRSVGLAMATYRFAGDEGSLLMIQKTNDPPEPEVFADWHGDYMLADGSKGMLMLDVLRCGAVGEIGTVGGGDFRCPADGTMAVKQTPEGSKEPFSFEFDIFVSSMTADPPDPGKPAPHRFAMMGLSTHGDPGVFVVMGNVDAMNANGMFMFFPMGIAETGFAQMGSFTLCNQFDVDETGS